jgi:hypothetical protein
MRLDDAAGHPGPYWSAFSAGHYHHVARAGNECEQDSLGRSEMGSDATVFAKLQPPQGYQARFLDIAFDRTGNMLVTMLIWKKNPPAFPSWWAYYRIEGMPVSEYPKRLMLHIGLVLLIIMAPSVAPACSDFCFVKSDRCASEIRRT